MQNTQDIFEKKLGEYYKNIEDENNSARTKAESYYAIIGIKRNNQSLERYGKPLYLDVKNFISEYLKSFDTEDYGYDIPNNQKLIEAVNALPIKEQLAMCRFASKLYENHGYEMDFLDSKINKLRMKIARKEKRYLSFLLRLSAYNVWTLLLSYVFFLAIVFIVLLPAPFDWMGILKIEPHNFDMNPFKNHLMNTLAIVTGGDYAPAITPKGLRGMLVIIIGKISFYLLIGNFLVKKLVDIFSFD